MLFCCPNEYGDDDCALGHDGSALIDLRCLVECMERMSCWPLANSAYVCTPACLLEFESVNY